MGFLDKLEVSNRIVGAAKRRRKKGDTIEYRREKLVANIEEQIELAQLCLNNQPLQLQRKRGHKVITVKPRLWWTEEPDGEIFVQIRYNRVPLNISGKGTAIKVGKLSNTKSH